MSHRHRLRPLGSAPSLRTASHQNPVLPEPVHLMRAGNPAASLSLLNGKVMVGQHPRMRKLFEEIACIAGTNGTVLISGETGTGKELVAHAIHEGSPRRQRELVAVDCSTLAENLVESELFGHCKGSFTGALTDKVGLFEAASGGTFLLDEVASLPVAVQPRLLRVLQNRTIRRVGEIRERRVDVRIIAATNRCLAQCVQQRQFRKDLYYRLNVFQLQIPSLRDRSSDVSPLIQHFVARLNRRERREKKITPEALKLLLDYPFPGNVRELENLLESAYHLSRDDRIDGDDISSRLWRNTSESGSSGSSRVESILADLVSGRSQFWLAVGDRLVQREFSRHEVQAIVSLGLSACGDSYRRLLQYFGLPQDDYKRFLSFLGRHKCKVDYRPYRKAVTL